MCSGGNERNLNLVDQFLCMRRGGVHMLNMDFTRSQNKTNPWPNAGPVLLVWVQISKPGFSFGILNTSNNKNIASKEKFSLHACAFPYILRQFASVCKLLSSCPSPIIGLCLMIRPCYKLLLVLRIKEQFLVFLSSLASLLLTCQCWLWHQQSVVITGREKNHFKHVLILCCWESSEWSPPSRNKSKLYLLQLISIVFQWISLQWAKVV